jgi:glycosyltransferase involved in cell wall biosynthesis
MRVAMISEHASPLAAVGGVDAGGQNLHVAELAAALARQGHEVTVYTRRDDPGLADRVTCSAGFDVVHVAAGPPAPIGKDELLPYMRGFGRWMRRRWAVGGWRPDVVHAHFWMSGVAAHEATAGLDVPVVLTFHALGSVKRRHQGSADTSPPGRIAIERRLAQACDRVIAQCDDEVHELAALGVNPTQISVIPSGVDLERFGPTGERAPRRPGLARILTVGRLVARKGYQDLIRALPSVPATELVIAGGPPHGHLDDPEAVRLRGLASDLGVADRVVLLGAVARADMPSWYRSADVLACTPWYEPFGLTPLEAMACGRPVVTYAVGGLAESVHHDVTGVHVRPGDVGGLVVALRDVLGDPRRRERYGRAALARARTRYAWDGTAAEVAAVYAEVAADRRLERTAVS